MVVVVRIGAVCVRAGGPSSEASLFGCWNDVLFGGRGNVLDLMSDLIVPIARCAAGASVSFLSIARKPSRGSGLAGRWGTTRPWLLVSGATDTLGFGDKCGCCTVGSGDVGRREVPTVAAGWES